MIRPPELSRASTSSHVVVKQDGYGKGNADFCQLSVSFILVGFPNIIKSYDVTDGFASLQWKPCYRILLPLKIPMSSTRFEPTNLGSNGNRTNHNH
jgi:hypothetical protein